MVALGEEYRPCRRALAFHGDRPCRRVPACRRARRVQLCRHDPCIKRDYVISTESTENYRHLCEWRHAKTGCEMVAIVSRLAVVPVFPWPSTVTVVPWLAVVPVVSSFAVVTPALIKPAFCHFH